MADLPRYRCYKEVSALKIKSIHVNAENEAAGALVTPLERGHAPFIVSLEYLRRNCGASGKPEDLVGGYFVVYKDLYQSWSPAEAFENGYVPIGSGCLMDFSNALYELRAGKHITRESWNNHRVFVYKVNGGHALLTSSLDGRTVNWAPSVEDVLAEDWKAV